MNQTSYIIGCILAIFLARIVSHSLYNYLECNSFIMITNQLCYGLIHIMYVINIFVSAIVFQIILKIKNLLHRNY